MFVTTASAFVDTFSFHSLTSMSGGIYQDLLFHYPNLQRVTHLFNAFASPVSGIPPLSETSIVFISLTPAFLSAATECVSEEQTHTIEKIYVAVQKGSIFVDVTLTLLALRQSIYTKRTPSILYHSATCIGKLLYTCYIYEHVDKRTYTNLFIAAFWCRKVPSSFFLRLRKRLLSTLH